MSTVLARPHEKPFTIRRPSSGTRRCSVRVAPIAENSSLLPPVGVWAVLNPSVAARPLRPAIDRRLGGLLPHQPANRPQAPPPASPIGRLCFLRSLCGLVGDFSPVFLTEGSVPMCYSPVRHSLSWFAPRKDVRLACVRHAASVYPEPGSNSPSKWVYVSAFSSREGSSCPSGICLHQRRETRAGDRSCDPGQAVCYLCKTLGCSQMMVILPPENGEMNPIDRNCMLACDVCGHRTCLL